MSSASAKLVNRGSYRDVQSIIHRSQPVRNLKREIEINVVRKHVARVWNQNDTFLKFLRYCLDIVVKFVSLINFKKKIYLRFFDA